MKYFFIISLFIISCNRVSKSSDLNTQTAVVFLSALDSANIEHDIKYLKEFPYVVNVVFVSKEEAKKEIYRCRK